VSHVSTVALRSLTPRFVPSSDLVVELVELGDTSVIGRTLSHKAIIRTSRAESIAETCGRDVDRYAEESKSQIVFIYK